MEKKIKSRPIHAKELSEMVGLTQNRLWHLANNGCFPKPERGVYKDLGVVIRGLLKEKEKKDTPAAERLKAAQARREERKDRQEAGEDIPAAVVIRAWEEVAATWKQRMLRVGNNVQSKIGLTEPQRAEIDAEVRGALAELAKKLTYAAQEVEEEEQEKPAEDAP